MPGPPGCYTDYGLLTCDKAVAEDVNMLFLQLTGLGRASKLKKLLQSPFTLHKSLLAYIDREINHARAGKSARIIAKMNALVDPEIIRALYNASMAGVRVELIIRGICCLAPRHQGSVGEHPRPLHRWPVPGAYPGILISWTAARSTYCAPPPTGCRATCTTGWKPASPSKKNDLRIKSSSSAC